MFIYTPGDVIAAIILGALFAAVLVVSAIHLVANAASSLARRVRQVFGKGNARG